MATAIFFGSPAHGHTNPTLPVVTELVRRGERVIYYSLEEFQAEIEQTGATFRSYGSNYPFDPARSGENGFKVIYELLQVSQLVLENLLDEVKQTQPNYILYDSTATWGNYFAQILHIPCICSMTMFGITTRLILGVPSLMLMGFHSQGYIRQVDAIGRQLSKRYGLEKIDYLRYMRSTGKINIVYTSRFFQPYESAFDDTYMFVGPSILPRPNAPTFPFEKLSGNPLLYISLGTIFNGRDHFYRTCLEAFADRNFQVVMSVGHHISVAELGTLPDNFIVQNVVPQLELLQHTKVFITHAGMNSASEALYYGVPLLAIPQATDQHYVAKRVAQLGAGKILTREKVTAPLLRKYVGELFTNPGYAHTSVKIGKTLRQAGGYIRAVDEIENMKQSCNIFL